MSAKLDNKKIIGVVCNNRDDPDKMGRCQIYFPHMGNKVTLSELPWHQMALPDHNNRPQPPQEGTFVEVEFPSGSGSVNGIIKTVLNGIHNPQPLTGIDLTKVLTGLVESLNFKPKINGLPDVSSVSESNETGAEKITTEVLDKPISSMSERIGLPSNLVTKALLPLYDSVDQVSTALSEAASSMTPALGAMIPGLNLNLSSLLSQVSKDGLSSEISSAIESFSAIVGSSSPLSGTNFSQIGKRIGDGAISNITNQLKGVTNFSQLENVISQVASNVGDILDTASLPSVNVSLPGPFGNIDVSLSVNGMSVSISDTINKLIEAFSSSISSITSATGELLGNSEIMSMYSRLPLEAQTQFKTALEKVPTELSVAFGKSNSFFGGS